MTVLLTCAGRRTSLLELFQDACHARGGIVVAADMDPLAPARLMADVALDVPRVTDDGYVPALLDAVRAHNVDLIVPTIDPELPVLAHAADRFADAGTRAVVSAPELLDVTMDKWNTMQHFTAEGIRVPDTWVPATSDPADWPEDLFVKPRRGSASKGAQRTPRSAAPALLQTMDAPMVQAFVDAPEMTVDALFDFNGTLLHYVPRLRIRTLAGESIQGCTLPDADVGPWLREVLPKVGALGARGPITLQAFLTEPTPTLSEINARFGGGFPLAHAAGGTYPTWLLDLHTGSAPDARLGRYREGLCMTRSFRSHFTESAPQEMPSSTR